MRDRRLARSILVGAFLVLLPASRSDALSANASIYNDANAHYRIGEYAEAVALYEQLVARGVKNGYVYHNLGNAHFKSGRIGRAILAYERALGLLPGDEDVAANLRFVNASKVDKEPELDANFATRAVKTTYDAFSAHALTLFASILLLCVYVTAAVTALLPGRRILCIVLLVVLGFSLSGTGVVLAFKIYDREVVQEAIVLVEEVLGRSGPREDYLRVFAIHEGTKVTIERVEREWFLVRLSNGIGGWINAAGIEKI